MAGHQPVVSGRGDVVMLFAVLFMLYVVVAVVVHHWDAIVRCWGG